MNFLLADSVSTVWTSAGIAIGASISGVGLGHYLTRKGQFTNSIQSERETVNRLSGQVSEMRSEIRQMREDIGTVKDKLAGLEGLIKAKAFWRDIE